jgi:predicted AlkP superfamily pyrophosphatase or phosphodiesterase
LSGAILRQSAGLALLLLVACAPLGLRPPAAPAPPPRLVLQITVDQLRGDLPLRFRDRFGPGGFRWLLERGAHYPDAHFAYSDTETAVGHATLVTGANPAQHGIVSNLWYDRAVERFVYAVEDERHRVVGDEAPGPHAGTSPRNLASSTVGDELKFATGGRARVFSVSGKDRAAIIPGGHTGNAFWYSRGSGRYVSSTFYYDALPAWAQAWNDARPADAFKGRSWELLRDPASYRARDDEPWEPQNERVSRTFPHPYGDGGDPAFYSVLGLTPACDELTLAFTKALIEGEDLGRGPVTDYLAVSFSATDYVAHVFGPGSREAEDNLLRLDRVLADLFAFLDARVGLENVLVVLSGDHGGPDAPEYVTARGLEAGRVDVEAIQKGAFQQAVRKRLGAREDLIAFYDHPWIYLNGEAVAREGLEPAKVEQVVAEEAVRLPGIHLAVTRSALLAGEVPRGELYARLMNNLHPTRSGDVYLVQEPYWFLFNEPDDAPFRLASIHGSPWSYDTHVPILFAGHRVRPRTVWRRVGPEDVAPTLSAYLGILVPSASVGSPLPEVLDGLR